MAVPELQITLHLHANIWWNWHGAIRGRSNSLLCALRILFDEIPYEHRANSRDHCCRRLKKYFVRAAEVSSPSNASGDGEAWLLFHENFSPSNCNDDTYPRIMWLRWPGVHALFPYRFAIRTPENWGRYTSSSFELLSSLLMPLHKNVSRASCTLLDNAPVAGRGGMFGLVSKHFVYSSAKGSRMYHKTKHFWMPESVPYVHLYHTITRPK